MAEHARFEELVAAAKSNIQEISPQDVASALKRGDALLIDVRDPDEWEEGHIPGAKNFSRGTVELEIEEVAQALQVHPNTVVRDWRLAKAWLKRELGGIETDLVDQNAR